MARHQPAGPAAPTVETLLDTLRRAPKRVSRQSRAALETAVAQLLRGAFGGRADTSEPAKPAEYRIDDVARKAGTTTRNVRAYQERGLLHPPRRAGRLALFDESHVARLKIIGSMLERGYTSAHIREMLDAWEQGKDLGDVLGLEQELVNSWADDQPTTMTVAQARELAGDQASLDRLVADKLIEVRGARAVIQRPKLLRAFAEMRGYGMAMDTVLDLHERIEPQLDEISRLLVQAGADHLGRRFGPDSPPSQADITELLSMLIRFRTLAMTSVTATLATSIERTIERALANYLATFIEPPSSEQVS
jgi:DNA-binding transcriptional MerR regulator